MTRWSTAKDRMIGKMPGDDWQQVRQPAPALRLHVRPSRQEAAVHGRRVRPVERMESRREPRLASARVQPHHTGLQRWVRDLNTFYRAASRPCMSWIPTRRASSGSTATISQRSVISFLRKGARSGQTCLLFVCNFTPMPRHELPGRRAGGRVLEGDSERRRAALRRQRAGEHGRRRGRAPPAARPSLVARTSRCRRLAMIWRSRA